MCCLCVFLTRLSYCVINFTNGIGFKIFNRSQLVYLCVVMYVGLVTFCHGPAGVPRLATRCLCLLSTWLVVCLVPCAPMSIVCPLPSCYVIIVSVAPAVSPSLPSFVSLYSSPCVCSPVLIRCLSCVHVM